MGNLNQYVRTGVFLLMWVLTFSGFSAYSADPTDQTSGEVEIIIRNSTFEFQGGILKPDQAASIVIHNQDQITHGFTSTLLADLDVLVESNGVTTLGKGIKGVHIDSGKTVRIHFLPNRPGNFPFRCDLHPDMKGELLVLSIGSI
ncbi:MAG: cupredoxin domain-containing protein [Nitrospirae bacterium]|nr:cupredoxin domain-containing protein [Nitrospirota bacterium]MBI3351309.1 cupredoxin domain-containing protein [Nitrospirota bacterium]